VAQVAKVKFIWRIADVIVGGIFIYAGAIKALDPVRFARDIDNYKILPWTIAAELAFYLPWLEIVCGVALRFHCRHGCRKDSRSRHYLRLLWSRQQGLELQCASPARSRNSRCVARALFQRKLRRGNTREQCSTLNAIDAFGCSDKQTTKQKEIGYDPHADTSQSR